MNSTLVHKQTGRAPTPPVRQEYTQSLSEAEQLRPSSKFGVMLLSLYMFLLMSRVLDVSPIWWLHIPMVLLLVLTVVTFFRGQFRIAFHSKITVTYALFTIWVVVCLPLSQWRGASVESVTWSLQALAIFIIIVQMIRTVDDWRKVIGAYAFAIFTASLLGFYVGRSVEMGRLALAGGSFGDPNELALGMVLGLPFWWYKAGAASGPKKLLYWLCTVPIYVIFAKTGSRSGLFALAVLFGSALFFAKGPRKLLICGVAVLAVISASVFLPDYMRARYFTIFAPADNVQLDEKGRAQLNSDIGSSEARKALLTQSIHMTFEHPIFGVGPGVFSYASWDQRKANTGAGGLAQVTHNTYTQISSETGLPGFLFYAATIIFSFTYTYRGYRKIRSVDPELAKSGQYLMQAIAAMAAGIFFLSVGYTHFTAVIFAFAAALQNVLSRAPAKETAPAGPPVQAQWQRSLKAPAPRVSQPPQLISPRRAAKR